MPVGNPGRLDEQIYAVIWAFQLANLGYRESERELLPEEELSEIALRPQADAAE